MPFFLSDYAEIFGDPVDEAASPIREVKVDSSLAPDSIRSPRRQVFSDLPTPAYNQTTFQAPTNFAAQNAHHDSPYDTGFIPIQPTYDTSIYHPQQSTHDGGFGSLNGAVQPSQSKGAKQKRRESGMLLMNFGLGQRKSSMQRMREENAMVKEESAFD